ncbi:hypothetical protein RRG08_063316 [Elysia crispata]|uniref:Uncharacterized protein n=1 Tax=Elysia crispata TaxID=231223 RepID=A0AAE1DN99_9GAST|nr:hypothetical protein RRG08_063316 [Elysia crispata]
MAKDRFDNPKGFNKYYDIAAKATDFGNRHDGAKRIAKDGSTSVSPNKRIHRSNPPLIPSKTADGKDRIHTVKTTLWEDSRFSGNEKSPPALSHRQTPPPTSYTNSHFSKKTQTKSTSTSSSFSRPKYPVSLSLKQKHNDESPEPKSILKNSPRRRSSIASDDDGLALVLKQTTIQDLSSSSVAASPAVTTTPVTALSPQSDPAGLLSSSHDLLSRLRICYTRSISERPIQANLYTADKVSHRERQGREEEILSRCSYRLSPRHRRSSEPSATKRVTFYDQAVRTGDGIHPPKH